MITRRHFLESAVTMGAAASVVALGGCANSNSSSAAATASGAGQSAQSQTASSGASSDSTPHMDKSAVVFFSRAGENFEVGEIEEGNTAVVGYAIAGKIVSDVYQIEPVEAYPHGYDDCVAQAKTEQNQKARPALVDTIPEIDECDTVYLGYPIWHSDLPMPVYTFLEAHNWSGKKIMPFCTHGDSGLCGTDDTLKRVCSGATVMEGLAIKGSVAQNDPSETNTAVNTWLAKVRS